MFILDFLTDRGKLYGIEEFVHQKSLIVSPAEYNNVFKKKNYFSFRSELLLHTNDIMETHLSKYLSRESMGYSQQISHSK